MKKKCIKCGFRKDARDFYPHHRTGMPSGPCIECLKKAYEEKKETQSARAESRVTRVKLRLPAYLASGESASLYYRSLGFLPDKSESEGTFWLAPERWTVRYSHATYHYVLFNDGKRVGRFPRYDAGFEPVEEEQKAPLHHHDVGGRWFCPKTS